VVAAAFGDNPVDMSAIGWNQKADILGSEEENTLDAILLLGLKGETALPLKKSSGSPGGTPEDAGGIGGGGHGVEVLVKLGRIDFLGFVDREEQVSSGTHNTGGGSSRKELEAGLTKVINVALGGMPATTGANAGIEGAPDALHIVGGLGFEGGGNGDDAPSKRRSAEEEPGKEVSLELVLARLAGEDDNNGKPQALKDGPFNGKGDLTLVRTEEDAAG
jgi:hypothetical protein